MNLFNAIAMGFIQGATEFLPVSSSGHLAIFKILFNVNLETGILFDVLLHIATLVAICAVYYKDVLGMIVEFIKMIGDCFYNLKAKSWNKKHTKKMEVRRVVCNSNRKMALMIIVTSIPTGIIGFSASDLIEQLGEILLVPGICLIVTGILLLISDRLPDGNKTPKNVSYTTAFIIGIAQGLATLPGLSRSGTTITTCVACKFERSFAVKYSFLMSIPAILGAALKEVLDMSDVHLAKAEICYYGVGMVVAAIVGYVCIKTMLYVVSKKKFTYFAYYCFLIGIVSIGGYFVML